MLPTLSALGEQVGVKWVRLSIPKPGESSSICKNFRRNISSTKNTTTTTTSAGTGSTSSPEDSNKNIHGHPPPPGDYGGGEMRSWQIHSYGGINELQLSTSGRVPYIKSPQDVLVKVHAASLNPIDLAMTKGYGAETINVLRGICDATDSGPFGIPKPNLSFLSQKKNLIEFPLTLGRDFAGTVVEMGHEARGKTGLRVGDEVYGVVGIQRQGSHADYVLVAADTLRRKPKNLNFIEAASIPYVALTTWSAIRITGAFNNLSQKRFLVLGGSGGVGTFAVQYLKSQGANVVSTCSTDALTLMASLGCDFVIDYKDPSATNLIENYAPYDCILDLTGPNNTEKSMEATKHLRAVIGQFITLSPPFLSNIDKFGIVGGTVKNLGDLLSNNVKTWNKGSAVTKWAFFIPNGCALENIADLVEQNKIQPVVHNAYKFGQIPEAFKKLDEGHLRGKIVIDMQ